MPEMCPLPTVRELETKLKLQLGNPALLEQALTHPSYLNENPDFALDSNERLEFLGDAVIGLVVARELYERCPGASEGELTQGRSYLVSGASLARMGRNLGLGKWLLMGRGEEATGGRERESNLAAVLEAVVGAVFADAGHEATRMIARQLAVGLVVEVDEPIALLPLAPGPGRKTQAVEVMRLDGKRPPGDHTATLDTEGMPPRIRDRTVDLAAERLHDRHRRPDAGFRSFLEP